MYTVALLNFEGPLDLLLQLIERSDMEITEVALSDITSQYLQYISQLPELGAGELNQFLELASRMIYLKSVALLPLPPDTELEEEILDLTEQLAKYRNYQTAARYLEKLIRHGQQAWPREIKPSLPPAKLPLPHVSLELLQNYFTKALSNMPEEAAKPTLKPAPTLAEMSERLTGWLNLQPVALPLEDFLSSLSNRDELVVAFLAILELTRQQIIKVVQDDLFGDIIIAQNLHQTELHK